MTGETDESRGAFIVAASAAAASPHKGYAGLQTAVLANNGRGSSEPRLIKNRLSHSTFPAKALTLPVVLSTDNCGTRLNPIPPARPLLLSIAHRNEPGNQMKRRDEKQSNKQKNKGIAKHQVSTQFASNLRRTIFVARKPVHRVVKNSRRIMPGDHNEERASW
jgi:hypothetical protein